MGLIERITGIGGSAGMIGTAAANMAEVFRENATQRMELDHDALARAIGQLGGEFSAASETWWDSAINGLSRLPRVVLSMGTTGLFGYAMFDPDGFSVRMDGLALVPDPVWWLMGAIVSFYFGAPVAQHCFGKQGALRSKARKGADAGTADPVADLRIPAIPVDDDFADNAALAEWAAERAAWQG